MTFPRLPELLRAIAGFGWVVGIVIVLAVISAVLGVVDYAERIAGRTLADYRKQRNWLDRRARRRDRPVVVTATDGANMTETAKVIELRGTAASASGATATLTVTNQLQGTGAGVSGGIGYPTLTYGPGSGKTARYLENALAALGPPGANGATGATGPAGA
jgi:hypothetical protein